MDRAPERARSRVHRVLLVEDNLDEVHTLAALLREWGHAVEYAINGYVALEAARRFRPNFLLLDLGLPGMDGYDVCVQIKRDPELCDVKVIAVTAYTAPEYGERAREVGFDGYYVKPIDLDALAALLGQSR